MTDWANPGPTSFSRFSIILFLERSVVDHFPHFVIVPHDCHKFEPTDQFSSHQKLGYNGGDFSIFAIVFNMQYNECGSDYGLVNYKVCSTVGKKS